MIAIANLSWSNGTTLPGSVSQRSSSQSLYAEHRRLARLALGMTENEAAHQLGVTKTAAQRAAALDRQMRDLGLDDPYVPVLEPPDDLPKLRRHRHSRYRFEPFPA